MFLHGYMWSMLPFLLFQAMRNFVSALERPGWVLAISLVGIVAQRAARLGLIFGHFGLPELGHVRRRAGQFDRLGAAGAGAGRWSSSPTASSAASICSAASGGPTGRAIARLWRLGLPIGLAMGFEGGVFSAAAYLMG